MPLPNFLIIGAGRTGTTSIYKYLGQHHEIYMSPIKEPRFFVYVGQDRSEIDHPFPNSLITDIDDYRALFDGVTDEKAIGEASTEYLTRPGTWQHIRNHLPDTLLVVGLRHPADRLFSYFQFSVREGLEPEKDFISAWQLDRFRPAGKQRGYHRLGYYARFLKPFYDSFPHHNIHPYLFEDLASNPALVVCELCRFLKVSTDFVPDTSVIYNPSGGQNTGCARLDPCFRQKLIELYRDDILETQRLTGCDLSSWFD